MMTTGGIVSPGTGTSLPNLGSQKKNRGGAVPGLLILRPGDLNNRLGCGVLQVGLPLLLAPSLLEAPAAGISQKFSTSAALAPRPLSPEFHASRVSNLWANRPISCLAASYSFLASWTSYFPQPSLGGADFIFQL